jgi:hypothetical protein
VRLRPTRMPRSTWTAQRYRRMRGDPVVTGRNTDAPAQPIAPSTKPIPLEHGPAIPGEDEPF